MTDHLPLQVSSAGAEEEEKEGPEGSDHSAGGDESEGGWQDAGPNAGAGLQEVPVQKGM